MDSSEGNLICVFLLQFVLPADWAPLNRPGFAEFLHFLYNITAPLILLKVTLTHDLSLRSGS